MRTFRRYFGPPEISVADRDVLFRKVLANDAIEQIVVGPLQADHLALGTPYAFKLRHGAARATSTTRAGEAEQGRTRSR